jgi:DNA-binding transcriptional ArsR family regulator
LSASPDLASVAMLIADQSRATMLSALLGGRALHAGELARRADISPQTASAHLAKLVEGGLIRMEKAGRHRYFTLSGAPVARALESLSLIAPVCPAHTAKSSFELRTIRRARTCYDHLAGALGVEVTNAMVARDYLRRRDSAYEVTTPGEGWFAEFGIDCARLRTQQRSFARACLDWSERRPHMAGALGAAFAERLFALGWIARVDRSRAIQVTSTGRRGLRRELGLQLLA